MKKKFPRFMTIFLIFFAFSAFSGMSQEVSSDSAQAVSRKLPPQNSRNETMNFNGRKMPQKDLIFSVIGVKVAEAGDSLSISVFFNDAVDTNSVHARCIFIDEKPIPPQTEFLFSKNRQMMRFTVKKTDAPFSLKIVGLRSFDGKPLRQAEIQNLEINSFFKYSPREQKWQKSKENQKF